LHLIQYESGLFTTVPRKTHARISVAFVLGEIPFFVLLVDHAPKFGREIQGVLLALEYEIAILGSVFRVLLCARFPAFEVTAATSVIQPSSKPTGCPGSEMRPAAFYQTR
jgi:hypothetical protein